MNRPLLPESGAAKRALLPPTVWPNKRRSARATGARQVETAGASAPDGSAASKVVAESSHVFV